MKKKLENWMKSNYLDFKWIDDEVIEIHEFGRFFVFDSKGQEQLGYNKLR